MASAHREIRVEARGEVFRGLEWPGPEGLALLLHATSFCADAWLPVWQAARATGAAPLRAVAIDQRGHGGTTAPERAEDYAWPELVADLLALLSQLGGEGAGPALLVGHSSGATACLAAAGMRPDQVAGVVAVEPVLFEPPGAAAADSFAGSRAMAERARRRRDRFSSRSLAYEQLAERFPYAGFAAAALDAYVDGGLAPGEDGSWVLRCSPQVEAWAYEGAAALDLWPCAERITAPVLLLAAEHSAMPPPLLDRLARGVRDLQVQAIPAATHFAALERPNEVGARIGRFAAGISGA